MRFICVSVALLLNNIINCDAFTFVAPSVTTTTTTTGSFYKLHHQMKIALKDDDTLEEGEKLLSFDEAGQAIKDEDEQARLESGSTGLTEEQTQAFEAKKSEYDGMRERIRARAAEMGVEKSVATQQAIEEAARRAMNREEQEQELDLSKIGFATKADENDPEEQLSDEEKDKIDKIGNMGLVEQAMEEFKNVKSPGIGATIRQTAFMLLIFAFTAGYILFLDTTIRDVFTNFDLIPPPDKVFDYSDLELPDGWTDMMTDDDLLM